MHTQSVDSEFPCLFQLFPYNETFKWIMQALNKFPTPLFESGFYSVPSVKPIRAHSRLKKALFCIHFFLVAGKQMNVDSRFSISLAPQLFKN
jgi:hypothetical protein